MPTPTPQFTTTQMADALRKARGIKAAAARSLGCTRETVVRYCKRYPSVAAVCDEQREVLVDIAEGKLTQEVDQGTEWAVKMVLTTLGKDRGYVTRHENTGKDGGAIELNHGGLTDDERTARLVAALDAIRNRLGGPTVIDATFTVGPATGPTDGGVPE
jgi:hypothetical protein